MVESSKAGPVSERYVGDHLPTPPSFPLNRAPGGSPRLLASAFRQAPDNYGVPSRIGQAAYQAR